MSRPSTPHSHKAGLFRAQTNDSNVPRQLGSPYNERRFPTSSKSPSSSDSRRVVSDRPCDRFHPYAPDSPSSSRTLSSSNPLKKPISRPGSSSSSIFIHSKKPVSQSGSSTYTKAPEKPKSNNYVMTPRTPDRGTRTISTPFPSTPKKHVPSPDTTKELFSRHRTIAADMPHANLPDDPQERNNFEWFWSTIYVDKHDLSRNLASKMHGNSVLCGVCDQRIHLGKVKYDVEKYLQHQYYGCTVKQSSPSRRR